jgi:hypothetical protein
VVKNRETATAGTRRATTIEQGDATIVETELANQTAAATAPTPEAGKVKISTDTVNDLARHDHVVRVETGKDNSIPMPASYMLAGNVSRSKTQIVLTEVVDGKSTAPTPLAQGEFGQVQYRKNRFLTYDGIKSLITYLDDYVPTGWEVTTDKITLNFLERVQRGKNFYKRLITFDCYITQRSSKTTAYSDAYDARGTDKAMQGTEVGSSRVEVLRNGQYRAFWIGKRTAPSTFETDGTLPI